MLHGMSRSWGSGSGQTKSSSSSSVTFSRRISLSYAHHSGGTAFSPGARDNSAGDVISAASSIASFVSTADQMIRGHIKSAPKRGSIENRIAPDKSSSRQMEKPDSELTIRLFLGRSLYHDCGNRIWLDIH